MGIKNGTAPGAVQREENMGKIINFAVTPRLHPGLSDAGRLRSDLFPATQAGLALAEDTRDYKAVELRGCYGSATAGLYARLQDGEDKVQVPINDIPEDVLRHLPMGSMSVKDFHYMTERVWDGHNHVQIPPTRSRRLWAQLQFAQRPLA